MRRLLIGTLALTMTFPPLPAQKIDTETPSRERVVRVQTAMTHLTVIEVAEPVATVAVGSPQAFKVERRENKVFIQPLQENVATNLFIWTASTRLNYELVPAVSDAGQMDFAMLFSLLPHVSGVGRTWIAGQRGSHERSDARGVERIDRGPEMDWGCISRPSRASVESGGPRSALANDASCR